MTHAPITTALDWQREPLAAPRRVLIEASAGTGKTYTLTLLYLRLLLEAPDESAADVRGILVSTFTDAAAAELRLRLRQRLAEAEALLQQLEQGAPVAAQAVDGSLAAYLAASLPLSVAAALLRVRRARQDLDLAPILTLHGFCARVLAESAFESGGDLAPGEHVDERALIEECVRDFWRQRYQRADIDADERALLRAGPEALYGEVRDYFTLAEPQRLDGGRAELDALLPALCTRDALNSLAAFAADRTRYAPRKTKLATMLRKLHEAVTAGASRAALGKVVEHLDPELVMEQQHPDRPGLIDEPILRGWLQAAPLLRDWPRIVRGAVLSAAIDFCRTAIPQRLAERGASTYGAFIARVRQRIDADAGFARHLFERYPVALIDEFQDTDRHQYAIFDAIYAQRGTLLLVGDPKQAIYAFRGGDIATYRRAAAAVDARVALAVNWRSTHAYVAALNALYAQVPSAHMGEGIAYQPVSAGGKAEAARLCCDGRPVTAPLLLRVPVQQASSKVDETEAYALDACAADIAALLQAGRHMLGPRPLAPGDIAVLLPTNAQIAQLRELLATRGVPAAGSGKASVFATDTAAELALLLQALLEPAPGIVRAAWLTDLWGMDAADLRALDADTALHDAQGLALLELAQLWRERGPLAPVLAAGERAASRLLARQDGERILTDLRHLGELLQQQAAAGASPHAQLTWLQQQRAAPEGDDDLHLQRIDSDRARVQLRTLAGAKGLQWPLVFLPLAWRPAPADKQNRLLRFHDADDRLSVDLGSAQRALHAQWAVREAAEERARLLYVALTRAEQACWVYWLQGGSGFKPSQSAFGQLLCAAGLDDGIAADAGGRLRALCAGWPGVVVDDAPADTGARYSAPAAPSRPRAAQTSPPLPPPWQHWSFTALTRQAGSEPRAAADESDAVVDNLDEVAPAAGSHEAIVVLGALRGPAFGDAVHALLETAAPGTRFADDPAALLPALADAGVSLAGLDMVALAPQLAARLDAVRRADLGGGLALDTLAGAAQVAEMEFLLPLQALPVARLRAVLQAHGAGDWLPEVPATVLRGMLGGFIDRVVCRDGRYHVIDYKTNWLGESLADYGGDALDRAMRGHHYPLQALLYVLALHRLLRQRLPGYRYAAHMGDALYLFVRALGLAPGAGLWRQRFDAALVHALDALCNGASP